MGLFVILNAQNSLDNLDAEQFYTAFSKILNSADNYFNDITSNTKIQTRYGEEQKVNVDFPGADVAPYYFEEYEDDYGFYCIDYVTVFYFYGNDLSTANAYYDFLKNCINIIKDNEKFGIWKLEEKITEKNGIKTLTIEMINDEYPDLYIYMDYKISETEQDITLSFEQEDWDY